MTTPTAAAYTHAKAPASEGVNRPNLNPAIRMTGKRKAQMHSTKVLAISLNGASFFSFRKITFLFGPQAYRNHQKQRHEQAGIIPAVNNRPMETSAILPYKNQSDARGYHGRDERRCNQ